MVRPLRRKLLSSIIALGLLGLLVVGVTTYTVVQWRETEQTLSRHYLRSLRLQEVRALTFEAFKEVPDALIGLDENPRQDYDRRLEPIGRVFDEWAALAEDDEERAEVTAVRQATQRLDRSAHELFDLVDTARRDEALARLEAVEQNAFEPFERLTEQAVDSDRRKREIIRADAADARRTATLTLAVATVGVLSLLLLVAAFLSGGVFGPLRRLTETLRAINAGDATARAPQDGNDELADLGRQINVLVGAAHPAGPSAATPDSSAQDAQLVLGRLVDGVREQAQQLSEAVDGPQASAAASLAGSIDALSVALARMGAFAYPVELRIAPVQPAALLHEVLDRFGDEVVRRAVSTEIVVDPSLDALQVDRARLRETLGELVRNALDAMPARGGALVLRAVGQAGGSVALEVKDDGAGLSETDVAWLYDGSARPQDTRGVGLRLATSVIEQHGGRLQLEVLPAGGTVARVLLPAPRSGTAFPTRTV